MLKEQHRFINQTLTVTSVLLLVLAGLTVLEIFMAPAQSTPQSAQGTQRGLASLGPSSSNEPSILLGQYQKVSLNCTPSSQLTLPQEIDKIMLLAPSCGASDTSTIHIKNLTTEIEASVFKVEETLSSSDLISLLPGVNKIEIFLIEKSQKISRHLVEINRIP